MHMGLRWPPSVGVSGSFLQRAHNQAKGDRGEADPPISVLAVLLRVQRFVGDSGRGGYDGHRTRLSVSRLPTFRAGSKVFVRGADIY